MKEIFIDKRFGRNSLDIIKKANNIMIEYEDNGYYLTLRQLYYQFVSRGFLPNTSKSYKRLGGIINDARLAGMIDWSYIKDLTRNLNKLSSWNSPVHILHSALESYRKDKWRDSSVYIEIWVEKDALIEVVKRAANEYEVPSFSCRGYVSQSAMYEASKRLIDHDHQDVLILHLGDHDPSGIDMTRDINDRLHMFGTNAEILRIALNYDQINEYKPPPNPAKITDSRYIKYVKKYSNNSWELDALDPLVIHDLILHYIEKYIDKSVYDKVCKKEEQEKKIIFELIEQIDNNKY